MKLSHLLMRAAKNLPPDFLDYTGSATDGNLSSGTYTAPLPTHAPGDLLVVFLQLATQTSVVTAVTSGWTYQGQRDYPSKGNLCYVYTKIAASSSEVFTATLSAGTAYRTSVALSFRSQTGRVPQFAWLYSAYNEHSFPEVIPSAGLQKYTWLPCFAARRNNVMIGTLTMPSGYSTILGPDGGGTGRYGRLAVGLKSTYATSETPGAMGWVGNSVYEVTIVAAVWEEEE